MATPIRTLAEKVVLRHSIGVTPETRLIAAIIGQAIGDLHSTHTERIERIRARYFLANDHAARLAGAIGVDIELVREWVANIDAWQEQQAA
ncbi:MAG: hypothetical protein RLZZ11_1123 [Cyanobacteriota bacterium]|jgi:hypothetical protein